MGDISTIEETGDTGAFLEMYKLRSEGCLLVIESLRVSIFEGEI